MNNKDEITHLLETLKKLQKAFTDAENSVEKLDREYMDTKRYMVLNRGEIDPHEMFQNELSLRQVDHLGAFTVDIRDKLARLKDSPYFARIDFQTSESAEPETYYIGQFAFRYKSELAIVDWRAPVAGMFYDCKNGLAGYDAPCGRIDGKLILKRQFKIRNGVMEYALETSENIQDDVLFRELSSTSDEKMKSIITTIQKEQNQIIRDDIAETLIIQGVAGSGKTSIALHRIAFFLYKLKDRLSAQNVTIISPNRVFGDYISNVLPELGEEPIYEVSFIDIAKIQLDGVIGFEADSEVMDSKDVQLNSRIQYKSTLGFVKLLDDYIDEISDIALDIEEYASEHFFVSARWIQTRLEAYKRYPLMQRLSMTAEDMREQFITDNIMEHEVPGQRTILKNLKSMLKYKSTIALYKNFYKKNGVPNMIKLPSKKVLEWNDVYPFLYLHSAFFGLLGCDRIRHVVVDEMQDYTPIQFSVINQLFQCRKTILGDFGQAVNQNHHHTLEDLQKLYPEAKLVKLNTSYRSTYEIINFAKKIQDVHGLEAIERHGPAPEIIVCESWQAERMEIINLIRIFDKSRYNTLGIIMKTEEDAQRLFDELAQQDKINLITPESKRFEDGITITSVRMSKGLEFDQVILPGANKKRYHSEYDRSLLYVACTRAMHQLQILYSEEKSLLLP